MSKKQTETLPEQIKEIPVPDAPFDFETAPLETFEDYRIWNQHAHRAFRDAKRVNPKAKPPFPVRVPPVSMHRMVRVKFQRFDQPANILKVILRNKDIHWTGQLKPGRVYDLPLPVVRFLNGLATPIFQEVKSEEGGQHITETKQVGELNRFSCHMMDLLE